MKKKTLAIILTIFILIIYCSCSDKSIEQHEQQIESAATEQINTETKIVENEEEKKSEEQDVKEKQEESNIILEIQALHSLWFDGIEMKVMMYLDDNNMLVKFPLGDYMVQAVLPRSLEEKSYISEYYPESYGENSEVYLKLTNNDKQDAIYVAYGRGEEAIANFGDFSLEAMKEIINALDDEIYEIETLNNGIGIIAKISDEVKWSEYDRNSEYLPGYVIILHNSDEKMCLIMNVLNSDVGQLENIKMNMEQVAFRKLEDNDYKLTSTYSDEEVAIHMDNIYAIYREIMIDPDKVLQEQYQAFGENYRIHGLKDVTGDGIPEIVFWGNPKTVCIIGETNAVSVYADDIIWTEDPKVFYLSIGWTGEMEWDKCELVTDTDGNMTINVIEDNYLTASDYYGYSLKGEVITAEEFEKIVTEMKSAKIPKPWMLDADEIMAGKNAFYRSVKRITDGNTK